MVLTQNDNCEDSNWNCETLPLNCPGGFCKSCENNPDKKDPITLDIINKGKGICIQRQCYDVDSIERWLNRDSNSFLPHNKQPYSNTNLKNAKKHSLNCSIPESSPNSRNNSAGKKSKKMHKKSKKMHKKSKKMHKKYNNKKGGLRRTKSHPITKLETANTNKANSKR